MHCICRHICLTYSTYVQHMCWHMFYTKKICKCQKQYGKWPYDFHMLNTFHEHIIYIDICNLVKHMSALFDICIFNEYVNYICKFHMQLSYVSWTYVFDICSSYVFEHMIIIWKHHLNVPISQRVQWYCTCIGNVGRRNSQKFSNAFFYVICGNR